MSHQLVLFPGLGLFIFLNGDVFNPYKHIICYRITWLEWNTWSWAKWCYIGL